MGNKRNKSLKMTNSSNPDVSLTGSWCYRMVARDQDCHSTAAAADISKQITTCYNQRTVFCATRYASQNNFSLRVISLSLCQYGV